MKASVRQKGDQQHTKHMLQIGSHTMFVVCIVACLYAFACMKWKCTVTVMWCFAMWCHVMVCNVMMHVLPTFANWPPDLERYWPAYSTTNMPFVHLWMHRCIHVQKDGQSTGWLSWLTPGLEGFRRQLASLCFRGKSLWPCDLWMTTKACVAA